MPTYEVKEIKTLIDTRIYYAVSLMQNLKKMVFYFRMIWGQMEWDSEEQLKQEPD